MVFRKYKDFNEAYLGINTEILRNPSLVEYLNTTMGGIDNVFLQVKSPLCDKIDLGRLGYRSGKWSHLIRTYLGPEKLEELKHLGENIKGLSAGLDFLRKSTGNGACMREILISRKKRGSPWDSITIIWRTTELQRRWAADLILISRIMELIPNSDFTTINLVLNTCYQSAMYIIPLLEPIFGVRSSELDPNHFYTKVIITREAKYYKPSDSPHKLLASGERIRELYKSYQRGEIPPSFGYNQCKL